MIGPNDLVMALQRQAGYVVVSVQPPDGAVVELSDGSRWGLAAYRQVEGCNCPGCSKDGGCWDG